MRLRLLAPLVVLLVATAAPVYANPALDLDGSTIPSLQHLMDRGRLTAVALTEKYLGRIRAVDPKINSVIILDPTALAQAKASDRRRHDGKPRGPLDGIPVLLKDNVDT
ncbi:amidase family protein, partial [Kibdelosporangium lantanae]